VVGIPSTLYAWRALAAAFYEFEDMITNTMAGNNVKLVPAHPGEEYFELNRCPPGAEHLVEGLAREVEAGRMGCIVKTLCGVETGFIPYGLDSKSVRSTPAARLSFDVICDFGGYYVSAPDYEHAATFLCLPEVFIGWAGLIGPWICRAHLNNVLYLAEGLFLKSSVGLGWARDAAARARASGRQAAASLIEGAIGMVEAAAEALRIAQKYSTPEFLEAAAQRLAQAMSQLKKPKKLGIPEDLGRLGYLTAERAREVARMYSRRALAFRAVVPILQSRGYGVSGRVLRAIRAYKYIELVWDVLGELIPELPETQANWEKAAAAFAWRRLAKAASVVEGVVKSGWVSFSIPGQLTLERWSWEGQCPGNSGARCSASYEEADGASRARFSVSTPQGEAGLTVECREDPGKGVECRAAFLDVDAVARLLASAGVDTKSLRTSRTGIPAQARRAGAKGAYETLSRALEIVEMASRAAAGSSATRAASSLELLAKLLAKKALEELQGIGAYYDHPLLGDKRGYEFIASFAAMGEPSLSNLVEGYKGAVGGALGLLSRAKAFYRLASEAGYGFSADWYLRRKVKTPEARELWEAL